MNKHIGSNFDDFLKEDLNLITLYGDIEDRIGIDVHTEQFVLRRDLLDSFTWDIPKGAKLLNFFVLDFYCNTYVGVSRKLYKPGEGCIVLKRKKVDGRTVVSFDLDILEAELKTEFPFSEITVFIDYK